MQGRHRSLTKASRINNTNEKNGNILNRLNSFKQLNYKDNSSVVNDSKIINNGSISLGVSEGIKRANERRIVSQNNLNSLYKPLGNISGNSNVTVSNAMMSSILTFNSFNSMSTTNNFNAQFNNIVTRLEAFRMKDQQKLSQLLSDKTQDQTKMRSVGVKRAWQYEKAEIEMGGKGTTEWSKEQQNEILETGKVRGAEGHHINNVADNPELQANPDNIVMAKDKKQHLNMHKGDFKNSTDGELMDRDARLKDTNSKRVFKNELRGVGIAAAIGLGIGFTIGFTIQLAKAGISPENIKNAVIIGGKAGIESGMMGAVGHVIGRTIGEATSLAAQGVLQNLGIIVSENISKMCSLASIGAITITVFSIYQFVKLKLAGYSTKESIIRTAKGTLFSLSTLAISLVAQGMFGGVAGVVAGASIGVLCISYTLVTTLHDRKLNEALEVFIINKSMPRFEVC